MIFTTYQDATPMQKAELADLRDIVREHYGYKHQVIKLAEEAAELAQAAAVYANDASEVNFEHLLEEAGDVDNVLHQILRGREALSGYDPTEACLEKMRREVKRIEEENISVAEKLRRALGRK